jgi:hypothetical protein
MSNISKHKLERIKKHARRVAESLYYMASDDYVPYQRKFDPRDTYFCITLRFEDETITIETYKHSSYVQLLIGNTRWRATYSRISHWVGNWMQM